MSPPSMSLTDVYPIVPAIILVAAATFLMLSEAFLRSQNRGYQSVVAMLATIIAGGAAMMLAPGAAGGTSALVGFAVHDSFGSYLTLVVCGATLLVVLFSPGFLRAREAERGEYYALVLFATAGMSLLVVSAELMTIFVNLEVLSLATYALAAYLRRSRRSAEASIKYFILGAFASAVFLYGAALLYGAVGSTHLDAIRTGLPAALADRPGLVYAGVAFIIAGFAFKVGAVPFHMWAPDVYEGSPTPITGLMGAGVKAAAFIAMIRVLFFITNGVNPQVIYVTLSALAAATMIGGNLLSIPQRNVKRMLAYSSIAHAGYLLVGVAALYAAGVGDRSGLFKTSELFGMSSDLTGEIYRAILYYLLGYGVTAMGALGVLGAIERWDAENRTDTWDIDRLAGLAQRHPGWAFAMALFMLSLGGIPITVGFVSKVVLLSAAVKAGMIPLVVLAVLTSAAGVYVYLKVIVAMYMRPATEESLDTVPHWATHFGLALASLAVVMLGILPGMFLDLLTQTGLLFRG